MKKIVIASNNQGKIREYQAMLKPLGYEVLCPRDLNVVSDPEETGTNYEENSYIKAKALCEMLNIPCCSDDSGLEIDALDNFPGLKSARYADDIGGYPNAFIDINKKLEDKDTRDARFVCTICYLETPESKPIFFKGECPGYILHESVGQNGFGYDPIFHSYECDLDFGACSPETKNKYSHRSKALQKLTEYLTK